MDLTETGAPRVSKPVTLEAKSQFIMASNGSLISSGNIFGLENVQGIFILFHFFFKPGLNLSFNPLFWE